MKFFGSERSSKRRDIGREGLRNGPRGDELKYLGSMRNVSDQKSTGRQLAFALCLITFADGP